MTTPIDPAAIASAAGIKQSGWLKVGKGRWEGHVCINGVDVDIEELASSWRAGGNGSAVTARSLEQLLAQLTQPSKKRSRR